MTLSAEHIPSTRNVKVRMNYGPIQAEITEDHQHVENFMASINHAVAAAKAYVESQEN